MVQLASTRQIAATGRYLINAVLDPEDLIAVIPIMSLLTLWLEKYSTVISTNKVLSRTIVRSDMEAN